MEIDEAPFEYVEEYGYPDIVGRHYEFEVSQIYEEFLDYGDFCNILESDDFPLKVEYKLAKELLESLSESLTPKGDDLFDYLKKTVNCHLTNYRYRKEELQWH